MGAGGNRCRMAAIAAAASRKVAMSTTARAATPPAATRTPPRAAPIRRDTSRTWELRALAVIRSGPSGTRAGSIVASAARKKGVRQLLTNSTT